MLQAFNQDQFTATSSLESWDEGDVFAGQGSKRRLLNQHINAHHLSATLPRWLQPDSACRVQSAIKATPQFLPREVFTSMRMFTTVLGVYPSEEFRARASSPSAGRFGPTWSRILTFGSRRLENRTIPSATWATSRQQDNAGNSRGGSF